MGGEAICRLQRRRPLCDFPDRGGCQRHVTGTSPLPGAPAIQPFVRRGVAGPAEAPPDEQQVSLEVGFLGGWGELGKNDPARLTTS